MLFSSLSCRTFSIAVTLACSLCLAVIALADGLRTVALTGEQVPGAEPGVEFSGFERPVLNVAGQTAFIGSLTGTNVNSTNDFGIYNAGRGSLVEVARVGNQAPGADPGVVFNSF